jgi:plastocyanin
MKTSYLAIGLIIVFSLFLLTHYVTQSTYAAAHAQGQQLASSNTTLVGAGGSDALWDDFVPQNIDISVGDSVTWHNPSPVTEPHTVTIMTNNTFFPPLAAPFSVSNTTALQPQIPNPNVAPLIIPSNQQSSASIPRSQNKPLTIIIDNARAYNPVAIDSTGKNVTYLSPNANYITDGTESYVNSGFIFPVDQAPSGLPQVTRFTITFEKPGTYEYLCALHPWMSGTVAVR